MKTSIRSKTFETNSSSVHAITINPTEYDNLTNLSYFGAELIHIVTPDAFAYSDDELFGFQDLAGYLLDVASYFGCYQEFYDKINNIAQTHLRSDIYHDPKETECGVEHPNEKEYLITYLRENDEHLIDYLLGGSSISIVRDDYCGYQAWVEEHSDATMFL